MAFFFETEQKALEPKEVYELFYTDKSEDAATKGFNRDRSFLLANGFDISYDESTNTYSLNDRRKQLRPLNLDEHEAASLAVAAGAMQNEVLFPLPFALRFALKKLTGRNYAHRIEIEDDTQLVSHLNLDSDIEVQRETASSLIEAILESRPTSFSYKKADGAESHRAGMPLGLSLYKGRWFALINTETGPRTFTVARIGNLTVGKPLKNGEPDSYSEKDSSEKSLEQTARTIAGLPFQWAAHPDDPTHEVEFIIPRLHAHRQAAITGGSGQVSAQEDGSMLWRTEYRNIERLFESYIENDLRLAPGWPSVEKQFVKLLQCEVSNHE